MGWLPFSFNKPTWFLRPKGAATKQPRAKAAEADALGKEPPSNRREARKVVGLSRGGPKQHQTPHCPSPKGCRAHLCFPFVPCVGHEVLDSPY